MAEVTFNLNGNKTKIKCKNEDLMKDICQKFAKENSIDISNMLFLYKGNKINPNSTFIQQISTGDKMKNRLSINCIAIKRKIETQKKSKGDHIRQSVILKKRNSFKDKIPVNEIRRSIKSLKKKVEINDIPHSSFTLPKVEEQIPKKEERLNTDLGIFDNYFRNYTVNTDIFNIPARNTENQDNNLNDIQDIKEKNDRNLTEATNIIIDSKLPTKPPIKIESIEKEMNQFEAKFESINNKIKEIINYLNQISQNINEFYEETYDKMIDSEIFKKDEEIIGNLKYMIACCENFLGDIDKSIEDNKITNISETFNHLMNTYKEAHKDIIKYKINEGDKEIRIFSGNFVLNNWDNCKIVCEDKEYPLTEKFNLENYKKGEKFLEIKLKVFRDMKDISFMFSDCTNLVSISKLLSWNMENIISMKGMFAGCTSLVSLPDLSVIKTNKVKNFRGIFAGCESLTSLTDISQWNTDNVTDMQYMFNNCLSLKTLPDISHWNTRNVTDMRFMFCNCKSLIALPDISKWNVKKVTNMQSIFEGCSSLISLPNINKWDIGKKADMKNMFNKCKKCLRIPLKFKKSSTTYNKLKTFA